MFVMARDTLVAGEPEKMAGQVEEVKKTVSRSGEMFRQIAGMSNPARFMQAVIDGKILDVSNKPTDLSKITQLSKISLGFLKELLNEQDMEKILDEFDNLPFDDQAFVRALFLKIWEDDFRTYEWDFKSFLEKLLPWKEQLQNIKALFGDTFDITQYDNFVDEAKDRVIVPKPSQYYRKILCNSKKSVHWFDFYRTNSNGIFISPYYQKTMESIFHVLDKSRDDFQNLIDGKLEELQFHLSPKTIRVYERMEKTRGDFFSFRLRHSGAITPQGARVIIKNNKEFKGIYPHHEFGLCPYVLGMLYLTAFKNKNTNTFCLGAVHRDKDFPGCFNFFYHDQHKKFRLGTSTWDARYVSQHYSPIGY